MKKYRQRPALRASDVLRWLSKGIFRIEPIPSTPIFALSERRHVRQTWLEFKKGSKKVIKQSTITYLRKGIFLAPIWQEVPDWEIAYWKKQSNGLSGQGIIRINDRFLRLVFMQDDDLNHAQRQQDHVLDQYLDNPILQQSFQAMVETFSEVSTILDKIGQRKVGLEKFSTKLALKLKSYQLSVRSIIANSPLFKKDSDFRDRQTALNFLSKVAREIRKINVRPVGTRLKRAARSIECATANIEKGRFRLAKNNLKSALKNLEYPKQS